MNSSKARLRDTTGVGWGGRSPIGPPQTAVQIPPGQSSRAAPRSLEPLCSCGSNSCHYRGPWPDFQPHAAQAPAPRPPPGVKGQTPGTASSREWVWGWKGRPECSRVLRLLLAPRAMRPGHPGGASGPVPRHWGWAKSPDCAWLGKGPPPRCPPLQALWPGGSLGGQTPGG